ncbi:hypothetical protein DFJ74DRAFT_663159 [Hyaloraphidium curvatum]|nr:hypothetical protein DFJ74DRAFT_663159 [Hyaloraphidium curvatum]
MDAFVGIWEDPTCPQEVPTARSSLCRDCRQFLWKIALHLARGRVDGVPDCAAQLAEVRQHARINKGDAEDSYFLRGRLNGLQYDRCVVAKRKIWGGGYFEIVAHRYREREVLVRAWRVHGGPWGLEVGFACLKSEGPQRAVTYAGRVGARRGAGQETQGGEGQAGEGGRTAGKQAILVGSSCRGSP